MRIGIGYDIHRLVKGRPLILGGVKIPYNRGLLGHSDGDVIYHAVIDAVLGAAGLGDIGDQFSDRDPANKGADSLLFVKKTRKLLVKKSFRIVQIDSIVIAQEPKLSVFKQSIRQSLAKNWGLTVDNVNVKAKTHEGLDSTGRGLAIACHAAVILKKGQR